MSSLNTSRRVLNLPWQSHVCVIVVHGNPRRQHVLADELPIGLVQLLRQGARPIYGITTGPLHVLAHYLRSRVLLVSLTRADEDEGDERQPAKHLAALAAAAAVNTREAIRTKRQMWFRHLYRVGVKRHCGTASRWPGAFFKTRRRGISEERTRARQVVADRERFRFRWDALATPNDSLFILVYLLYTILLYFISIGSINSVW